MAYNVVRSLGAVVAQKKPTETLTTVPVVDPEQLTECKMGEGALVYPCGYQQATLQYGSNQVRITPKEQWTEATFRSVRKDSSWLFVLEGFVANSISWLTPDGMSTAVYDMSGSGAVASVSPGLASRCEDAIRNFWGIFPPERWVENPNGTLLPWVKDGLPQWTPFTVWQEGDVPDRAVLVDSLVRALQLDVGDCAGRSKLTADAPMCEFLNGFYARCRALFSSVPRYTGPCCTTDLLVRWSWRGQPSPRSALYFWRVVDGELQPTSWTSAFLDTFSPKKTSLPGSVRVVARQVPVATRIKRAAENRQHYAAPTGGNTALIVLAVGALAGAGYLVYRWRQR